MYIHCNEVFPPDLQTGTTYMNVNLSQEGSETEYNIPDAVVSAQSLRYTTIRFDDDMTTNIPAGTYVAKFTLPYILDSKVYAIVLMNLMDVDVNRPYVVDMDNYTTYEG